MQVGVVAQRGRHHLRVRGGHDPRHVAAHALELFGLAAGLHAGRLRAHRLARLRQRAALRGRGRRLRARGLEMRAHVRRRCLRRGAGLRRTVRGRALDVVHRHHAVAAAGLHAGDVDAELARHRAHRRHRLDPADRDRGLAADRVGGLHRTDHGAGVVAAFTGMAAIR